MARPRPRPPKKTCWSFTSASPPVTRSSPAWWARAVGSSPPETPTGTGGASPSPIPTATGWCSATGHRSKPAARPAASRQREPARAPASSPVAARGYRQCREVGPGQGDAADADADVDRDPALFGPVDVPQVEQQGEVIRDERQAAAVADRDPG